MHGAILNEAKVMVLHREYGVICTRRKWVFWTTEANKQSESLVEFSFFITFASMAPRNSILYKWLTNLKTFRSYSLHDNSPSADNGGNLEHDLSGLFGQKVEYQINELEDVDEPQTSRNGKFLGWFEVYSQN